MGAEIDFFPHVGDVAACIRAKDWSQTALGPPDTWSPSLRTVLRLMLSSRYSMWMGWGPELTFFYNDAYARETLGKKHPSALGLPFREAWAEVWDALKTRIEHVMAGGEATWDEGLLLFLERSGYTEETYHTFSYSPAPGDAPGAIGGLFCVVIEDTERVIAARRIALLQEFAALLSQTNLTTEVFRAAESRLTADARDIPFSLTYLFDERGIARRASQTGFGDAHAAAPLEILDDVSLPSSLPWALREWRESRAPVVVALTSEHEWPRGAWAKPPTHALAVPIASSGQDRPAGIFIAGLNPHRPLETVRSFVELFVGQLAAGLANARSYEEEKKRADALAEVDRVKTAFFSNVSHEFRTPLTLMLGPTEDALGSADRALRGADLDTVYRNELRLLKLVNALLDFARIEAGRIQAAYEPTDLAALTADLASSFRSAIERGGLVFEVDCTSLGEPIFVDRDMWEKIVLNLLSNALKFTLEGRITVSLRMHDAHAELTVSDTGGGIEPAELPRLFERFHRIEGTRARTHEGSGIGLALVHELVRLHGGTIAVASTVDQGTTFTIAIPRGAAHLPAERVGAERAPPRGTSSAAFVEEALRWTRDAESAPPSQARERGDRPRIVVADDNADMREYIARLLRERWDVETVADGQAALDAVRRELPALLLSDVMMPRLDGFALLHAIRGDAALRTLPVILLSARAGEEASAEGLSAGADDYIVKPFAARDLVVRVASRLATAAASREANVVKENLYRHFMQAPFPVAVFRGAEHVVELANGATLRNWGKTETEAVGRPLLDVLPGLRDQPFIGYLDEVLRSGVGYEGRAELAQLPAGANGELEDVYFTFVYAPLFGPLGAPEGVLMSAFDVTAQVRSRQEVERARDEAESLAARLASASERLRTAQKVGGIGIFDWDLRTNAVHWSPELYALMGVPEGSLPASPEVWMERLFDDGDREAGRAALRDAIAERRSTMEVEVRLRQPDDRSRWVRLSSEIQYDEAGLPTRVLGAVVDVQLLKEAATARERALAEAERVGRAKDEFLATMSHELRTPLNAMLGWSRLLRASPADRARVERGLVVIERNAESQARLISDLLDVSRIISGKLRLSVEEIRVAASIHAAVDVVRLAAEAKGVQLAVDLDPEIGVMLADPDRVQQIVWNLLSNAVKFTPAGGTVTIGARREGSSLTIHVEDTGAGIEERNLPLIFERFQQVDSTTTRSHGGLGLGLAIVRNLVEAHGGTVEARSRGLGTGSTFTVTLPLRARFADPGARADAPSSPPTPADRAAAAERPLGGVRLLVVDDDEDSVDLLRTVFEEAGATVTSAPSAVLALDAAREGAFDLLVSDIGMPGMDGYDFMRSLRARDARIPAIALSAYARAEDAQKAREAGFQRHLAKPVDAEQLVATVRGLLRPVGEH